MNSLTLLGIALDRYLSIVKFVKGQWNPCTLYCTSWLIMVWGFAAGLASPMLTSYYVIEFGIIETDLHNKSIIMNCKQEFACLSDKVSNYS